MGQTIAEKILSAHSGSEARAGDIILADLDLVLFHDASRPHPIELLGELGGRVVFDREKVVAVIDHYVSPNEVVARRQNMVRQFARDQGLLLYDLGEGISHALLPEKGHVLPGKLIVGGDSHTCTYGAVNAFATGMGTTDIAVALITGKQWFLVPESLKIVLHSRLPVGVYAKDLILFLIGEVGADGATYKSVEFVGEAVRQLSMEARLTISNMAVEMGAKAGLFEVDTVTRDWLFRRTQRSFEPVCGDSDADYAQILEYDVSMLSPQIALPHAVDRVVAIDAVEGTPIHQGVLGTCTAARLEDFHAAASILAGRKVHSTVRFYVVPASKHVLSRIVQDGTLQTLLNAGAVLGVPGCGGCVGGGSFAVPDAGEHTITTANRNFRGRTGNPNAPIYLGSPATVAASVLEGSIADPRKYLR
jgi:3-isopropylmalate/(R)-2-methylmalate dehydratase large subunit